MLQMSGLTRDELVRETTLFLETHKDWLESEIQKELKKGKHINDAKFQALANFNQVVIPTLTIELINKNNNVTK
jgi:hypothetical protein